ncbi:hypothetical protein BD410DRAFT_899109 [Rickenella mellea]|uniref:Uncharacterized protein n=1 Tax=Rickenella mellea TaxID=50990 RepID=A0A4Y7Q1L7_9AGAM|nr:hypothetical protein BD410DRAFT_899109 [Rickenella mellea]
MDGCEDTGQGKKGEEPGREGRGADSLELFAGALRRRDRCDRGVIETHDGPRPTSTNPDGHGPPPTSNNGPRTTSVAQPRPTTTTNTEGGVRARGRTQSSSSGFALLAAWFRRRDRIDRGVIERRRPSAARPTTTRNGNERRVGELESAAAALRCSLLGFGDAIDVIASPLLSPSNHHLPTSPSPKHPTKCAPPHEPPAVRRVRVSPTKTALPRQCMQVKRGKATTSTPRSRQRQPQRCSLALYDATIVSIVASMPRQRHDHNATQRQKVQQPRQKESGKRAGTHRQQQQSRAARWMAPTPRSNDRGVIETRAASNHARTHALPPPHRSVTKPHDNANARTHPLAAPTTCLGTAHDHASTHARAPAPTQLARRAHMDPEYDDDGHLARTAPQAPRMMDHSGGKIQTPIKVDGNAITALPARLPLQPRTPSNPAHPYQQQKLTMPPNAQPEDSGGRRATRSSTKAAPSVPPVAPPVPKQRGRTARPATKATVNDETPM